MLSFSLPKWTGVGYKNGLPIPFFDRGREKVIWNSSKPRGLIKKNGFVCPKLDDLFHKYELDPLKEMHLYFPVPMDP